MAKKDLPRYVKELLKQTLQKIGIKDYSVWMNQGSQPGDGFTSEIFSLSIAERSNDQKLNVLCKVAPLSENHRKVFSADELFKREVHFYNELMPIFEAFQNEKNLLKCDKFVSYPKCYAAVADDESQRYAIIMDDLRSQGYSMWNKSKSPLIENIKLTLSELGKFHALSIALKDQKPNLFKKFKKVKDFRRTLYNTENMLGMVDAIFDRTIDSLKLDDHKNVMRKIKEHFIIYLSDSLEDNASDRFGVLCHGDFWNNNMLFRFDDSNIAENVQFIDWQIILYSSPAIDVLYNIFSSTNKTLRDEEYDNLLICYYKSLSKMVKLLGSNPDDLFTFDDLKSEMKRCGNFALVMAPILLQISQADATETTNMDEMFDQMDKGETKQEFISGLSVEGQQEYNRRINDVLEDIFELGYYRNLK